MNRFIVTSGTAFLLATCVVMLPVEAYGQKKKAPAKKTEEVAAPVAPATPPAPPPPVQGKMGSGLRDVLAKHKGEKTNLGLLTRVEGDCFVIEEKGVTTYYAFNAVSCIKVFKVEPAEEGEEESEYEEPTIEIVLIR